MKRPIHQSEVEFEHWYEGSAREIRGKPLCDIGGASKVGFGLMELPAGSNTRPAHWHSKEEEHLYVLSGQATLHLGSEQFLLREGSYVCFPAAQAEPHFLENDGPAVFCYLMIGERVGDDVVTSSPG